MEYKVIDVDAPFGGYDVKRSFRNVNPFTTAFCRTRDHGNIMLVGGLERVEYKLSRLGPTLAAIRMWHHGKSRGYTKLYNCNQFSIRREGKYGHRHNRQGLALYYGRSRDRIHWWRRCPSTFPRLLVKLLKEI